MTKQNQQGLIRCRVMRDTKNRDGFILRALTDGKVGFINHEAITLVNAGQIWDCIIREDRDKYFLARLIELIPFQNNIHRTY